ncbi:MAG TPA: LEPR-XLL domain-containing protein, partial [Phycisphaerae bacterium]|nr:LEPR-XLL domain-containing protein [Phycisphaerae bacterium]
MPFRTRSTQTPPHPPRTAITRRIRSFNQPSALMVEALESRVLMSVTPAGAAQASRGKVKGRGIVRVPVEINSKTMVSNIVAMTA